MIKQMLMVTAATGLASATPAAAAIFTLDFNPATACGVTTCIDRTPISQTYGDQVGIDVSFQGGSNAGPPTAVDPAGVKWWSTDYGDLNGVAYSTTGVGEIVLSALPGYSVTLNSLDVAGWFRTNINSSVRVYDLAFNLLFDTGTTVFPGSGFASIAPGVTSTTGLRLQWGADAFNGGIDNVSYSVDALVPSVPEPATWAMMILGFGFVGGTLRRRRTANWGERLIV